MGQSVTLKYALIYYAISYSDSYVMMRKCWEMLPEKRPSFKDLYTNTSQYIEHIAGYLDLGFNPFAAAKRAKSVAEEKPMENENKYYNLRNL